MHVQVDSRWLLGHIPEQEDKFPLPQRPPSAAENSAQDIAAAMPAPLHRDLGRLSTVVD